MNRRLKYRIWSVLLALIINVSILSMSSSLRGIAGTNDNKPTPSIVTPEISSSIVWNIFTAANMPPNEMEIKSHTVAASPISERSISKSRIARVVNPKYVTKDLVEHLIPLTNWELKIGNMPAKLGNIYLVRQNISPYLIQISEGFGYVIIEIRKADGSRLTEPNADPTDFALAESGKWLADTIQQKKNFYRLPKNMAPFVATWIIAADVPDVNDKTRFTYEHCHVYSDGIYLRYEVRGYLEASSRPFAPPAPYTFTEASFVPAVEIQKLIPPGPRKKIKTKQLPNSSKVGPLDYPVDKTVFGNPWLLAAASNWPAMAVGRLALSSSTPTADERKRFSYWVTGAINPQWLFDDIANVPYLANSGFVHVKTNNEYQIRIREALNPAYKNSPILTKAIVLAVKPLIKDICVPKTVSEFMVLLQPFLNPGLGEFLKSKDMPMLLKQCIFPPVFKELAGGMFLAVYPGKASLAIQLYAWTDGKILLVGFYEDVQYKSSLPYESQK